jgi:Uma2 family endonuclease
LRVDERLVAPEQRFEAIDGQIVYAAPSNEPHGTAMFDLAALLSAHLLPGYRGAVDMLVRANRFSDFAPDACIFPAERDPETGGRQLEELVFEIIDSQPLSEVSRKARLLTERGIRQIFCLDLPQKRAHRWSAKDDAWVALRSDESITDPTCLVRGIPVRALLNAASVDEATAAALLEKGTETLRRALDVRTSAGRAEGKAEGREALRDAVADLCDAYGIELTEPRRATLEGLDLDGLTALRLQLKRAKVWP